MDTHHNDGQVNVAFRAVRLPRSMRVMYPRDSRQLIKNWHACEGFLVAQAHEQLVGYIALTTKEDQSIVFITDLVVEPTHRQMGIGAALVRAAAEWSKKHSLFRLMTELQTKNYPAICFYQKLGFAFCGFNDHYYVNQDIALFFVQGLR
jgi:ribosomal protein S18 acetylase RimI-like enzyme